MSRDITPDELLDSTPTPVDRPTRSVVAAWNQGGRGGPQGTGFVVAIDDIGGPSLADDGRSEGVRRVVEAYCAAARADDDPARPLPALVARMPSANFGTSERPYDTVVYVSQQQLQAPDLLGPLVLRLELPREVATFLVEQARQVPDFMEAVLRGLPYRKVADSVARRVTEQPAVLDLPDHDGYRGSLLLNTEIEGRLREAAWPSPPMSAVPIDRSGRPQPQAARRTPRSTSSAQPAGVLPSLAPSGAPATRQQFRPEVLQAASDILSAVFMEDLGSLRALRDRSGPNERRAAFHELFGKFCEEWLDDGSLSSRPGTGEFRSVYGYLKHDGSPGVAAAEIRDYIWSEPSLAIAMERPEDPAGPSPALLARVRSPFYGTADQPYDSVLYAHTQSPGAADPRKSALVLRLELPRAKADELLRQAWRTPEVIEAVFQGTPYAKLLERGCAREQTDKLAVLDLRDHQLSRLTAGSSQSVEYTRLIRDQQLRPEYQVSFGTPVGERPARALRSHRGAGLHASGGW